VPCSQPFFSNRFFQYRFSWTIFLVPAWNCDPPDGCLLSSWDYKHEPLEPSLFRVF
jgi:hypothetical protein